MLSAGYGPHIIQFLHSLHEEPHSLPIQLVDRLRFRPIFNYSSQLAQPTNAKETLSFLKAAISSKKINTVLKILRIPICASDF